MAIELLDVFYELKRSNRKCKRSNYEWDDCKRLVEEKNIDSEYQQILYFILDNGKLHKRKRDDIIYLDDNEDGSDGEIETRKFCVVETEMKGVHPLIKYKPENGSGDESGQESERKMIGCAKQMAGLSNQKLNTVADHWPSVQACSGNKGEPSEKNKLQSRVKLEGDLYHKAGRRRNTKNVENPRKKFKVAEGTKVKEENEPDSMNAIQIYDAKLYKPGPKNNLVKEYLQGSAHRAQPSLQDKGKNVVGEGGGANRWAVNNVVNENEHPEARPVKEYERQMDRKFKGKYAVSGNPVIVIDSEDSDQDGNDGVEILDSAAFINQEILSPFVPSVRFHKSMLNDDLQDLGRPTASDVFRKEVLKVLSKPRDNDEYKTLHKKLDDGSYLNHFKDVGSKLSKHRYRKGKCLNILRGFFFWLQNLTREGAFRPWEDRQCLAVVPPSP